VLHKAAEEADGRTQATPSMVVIDTHLARGASDGGFTSSCGALYSASAAMTAGREIGC